jgi:hypothetical protein
MNALVGGWSVTAVGRTQTQVMDLGNVRLVGMTRDDLQSMYKFYFKDNLVDGRQGSVDAPRRRDPETRARRSAR